MKKKDETEWVLVDAMQTFRIRYMIEVPVGKSEWALDTVVCEEAKEFSQEWLGETIFSHRIISEKKALELCRKDNEIVASSWDDEQIKEAFFTRKNEHMPDENV